MDMPTDKAPPAALGKNIDEQLLNRFRQAVETSNAEAVGQLLERHTELNAALNAPLFSFDMPAVVQAAARGSIPILEVLLAHGADINRLSSWPAGGFGVLHSTCFEHPEVARWLIGRGAKVDVHAAAGLGDMERLRHLLQSDPTCLQQRGPDGQFALHFAADIATAQWLLDHGADLNARCVDHESTAAQWAIARAPELTRFLLAQGAETDIFLAVAVDDEAMVRRLIGEDPECLRARLGRPGYAPVRPGNILQWNLGWWAAGGRASPHRVAKVKGNEEIYQLLWRHSPADVRLMVAAWHGDSTGAQEALAQQPDLVAKLPPEDRRFLADAAWDGNVAAVKILLEVGFDPHVRGDHASTPLDRAAFHGFADVIALLLEHDPAPPLEELNEFGGRPLGALLYGCHHGWRDDGDPVAAAGLLAAAGTVVHPHDIGTAPDDVAAVLLPYVRS